MCQDSTGKAIKVGDRVRFRNKDYTIKGFIPNKGRHGCAAIQMVEPLHINELPDEWSVDLLPLSNNNWINNFNREQTIDI